jgi:hypothetical protein
MPDRSSTYKIAPDSDPDAPTVRALQRWENEGGAMKATRKPKRPRDPNQLAKPIVVDIETGKVSRDALAEDGKNPATVRRLGGQKGGKPRAKKLSASGGGRIARKATVKRREA